MNIDPADLRKRLSAGEKFLLLDVREGDELTSELGHIEGIVHIPLGDLPQRITELDKNSNTCLVTICKMGGRAARAAEFLQQEGVRSVLVLEGGMTGWKECGLPVETTSRK